jgi:serine/threonine protein kinase
MNLLMGHEQQTLPLIYLVDYGLARLFRDAHASDHVFLMTGQPFVGTTTFASVNTHKGLTHGRRDDIESLCYVLLYLLRGSLPWQTTKGESYTQRNRLVAKQKQARKMEDLFKQYPIEFLDLYKHARQLGFAQSPDYDYHKASFSALLEKGKSLMKALYLDPC